MDLLARMTALLPRRSRALGVFAVAVVVTHVPLVCVAARAVLSGPLTRTGVLGLALVAALGGTATALGVLHRLLRPALDAADGLEGYLRPPRP